MSTSCRFVYRGSSLGVAGADGACFLFRTHNDFRDFREGRQELDLSRTALESAETLLLRSEYEVVDVECLGEGRGLTIRIYIDKDGGVSLEDCIRLTRGLESHFEAEELFPGGFILEVSSPGIDRPVRKARDFSRFAGEKIQIVTYERIGGRTKHTGVLKGFDEDFMCVLVEGDTGMVSIPIDVIKKSRLKRDPWAEAKARAKN